MRHAARRFAVIGLLAGTAGCSGLRRDAIPVAGDWSLSITYEGDAPDGTINCAVRQEGRELSGRCDDLAILTGEVRGTTVNFAIAGNIGRDRAAPHWTTTFSGTVDEFGSRMTGTLAVSGQRGRFTALRRLPRADLAPPSA